MKPIVVAVYLSYNPDHSLLERSVRLAREQVNTVYIYDNASSVAPQFDMSNVHVIRSPHNVGVCGLNAVIDFAFEEGAHFIVIMDQDSELPDGFIQRSIEKYTEVPAIYAPSIYDRERLITSEYNPEGVASECRIYRNATEYASVDFVVGSGMIISKRIWSIIGSMRERFFLDCVDVDYCLRAKSQGVQIMVDHQAVMKHSIGNGYLSVFGKKVSNHSPFRHFLYYRNLLALAFYGEVPLYWRFAKVIKILAQVVIYSLFSGERLQNAAAFFIAFFGVNKKLVLKREDEPAVCLERRECGGVVVDIKSTYKEYLSGLNEVKDRIS
ncbi:glycosyltransferase [Pontibacterium sp.]|uniref:glycosyltransferase n=1 Tax=Pontibacterium sp. TaxID=2036026 RepID=UPI00351554DE